MDNIVVPCFFDSQCRTAKSKRLLYFCSISPYCQCAAK